MLVVIKRVRRCLGMALEDESIRMANADILARQHIESALDALFWDGEWEVIRLGPEGIVVGRRVKLHILGGDRHVRISPKVT